MKKKVKIKRTFLIHEEVLTKLKEDSEKTGISLNECLEVSVKSYISSLDVPVNITSDIKKKLKKDADIMGVSLDEAINYAILKFNPYTRPKIIDTTIKRSVING